jgi:hypothetical protein
MFYLFLLPTRFSLLAVVIVGWAFLRSDQGADILRALVEYDPCKDLGPHHGRMFAFVLAVTGFSLQAWYWTRQILRVAPPSRIEDDQYFATPPPEEKFPLATIWIPRLLGTVGFLIPIFAFFPIRASYVPDDTEPYKTGVHWMLGWLLLALALFLVFVVLRRAMLNRQGATLKRKEPKDFDRSTKAVLGVSAAVGVAFFLWATLKPTGIAPLGSASVVFLTAALWIPFGTVLVLFGIRLRFPILSALMVWALLASPLADRNHVIRSIDPGDPGLVNGRLDTVQQLEAWYNREAPLADPTKPVPIFVVATEGGGIRAAYWTAAVLTTLQDNNPKFAEHLFAISSVSGGSLGAVVFDALLARQTATQEDEDERVCPGRDPEALRHERSTLRYAAKRVLSFDSLTPTLAGMTQPDLAQRFLPFGFPDREEALEEGWEQGWSNAMKSDLFSQGLLDTIRKHDLPSLFINGTMVETGDRIVTSNCRLHPKPKTADGAERETPDQLTEFRNVFDAFAHLRQDIPFSAAAGMSARFTYVSPAGRLPSDKPHETVGHVVDGGYYENSGAVTAAEIVNLIRRVAKTRGWSVEPYVILIDFGDRSQLCRSKSPLCGPNLAPFPVLPGPAGPTPGRPETWANEVLSPLRALLNTRGARGNQAVSDLREMFPPTNVVNFRLIQRGVPLPLGWLLSERSRIEIDQAIAREGGNRRAMEQVRGWLGTPLTYTDPVAASAAASTAMNEKESH